MKRPYEAPRITVLSPVVTLYPSDRQLCRRHGGFLYDSTRCVDCLIDAAARMGLSLTLDGDPTK